MAVAGDSVFFFSSRSARGHIDNSALAAIMARLPGVLLDDEVGAASWKTDPPTPHDLRRTCATRLAAAGTPVEDVSAILNHARADVTGRHYDHYSATEKRAALERWSRILATIIEPSSALNVVAWR
jgi:integrase